jgi:HD-GYP domain-containing protein (c-di-GMP phosphodiesterase class II)
VTTADQRLETAGRLLRALATAQQAAALYPAGHPERLAHGDRIAVLARELATASGPQPPTLFVDRGSFYLGVVLLPRESLGLGRFAGDLEAAGIESMTWTAAISAADVDALVEILGGRAPLHRELGAIQLNAVRPNIRDEEPWEERLRSLRRAYAAGVTTLRRASEQAALGEPVDLEAATAIVDQLHDEVEQDPGYGLLLSAVKSYDEYTYFHMVNVCLLSVALGQAIGLRRDQVRVLGLGGLLHDIGKVFVPPEILRGSGRLDEEQWRLIQRHPVDGAGMMLATGPGLYHPATTVLLEHHAAYDRSGYPTLHGHAPSAPSRLVAVADCFDAVTSKRSYREPLDRPSALELLGSTAGHGLDPHAVASFQALLGRFPVGSLVRLSSGEVAVVVRQHPRMIDRPTVLVLFDATDTPVEVEERDLAAAAPAGPRVIERVDPDAYGVDLPRFVASGQLHATAPDRESAGGLVHEPSPGEQAPEGYVDTHTHDHAHPPIDGRPDPDVAPPIDDPPAPPPGTAGA